MLPIGNYIEQAIIYFDKTQKMLLQFETFVSATTLTDWQVFTGEYMVTVTSIYNYLTNTTLCLAQLSYPLEWGGYNHLIISKPFQLFTS